MTGPSPKVRKLVYERDGYLCAICGQQPTTQIHHRRARKAGGSKLPFINQPANLASSCFDCNTNVIEQDPKQARLYGWTVTQWQTPEMVPMLHALHGWCFLADDGSVLPVQDGAA